MADTIKNERAALTSLSKQFIQYSITSYRHAMYAPYPGDDAV